MVSKKKTKKSKSVIAKQPLVKWLGIVFGLLVVGFIAWKMFPKQKVDVFEVGVTNQTLRQQPELWFGVNGRSEEKAYPSDFSALFTSPNLWTKSRAATDVFVFNQSADYLTNIYRDNFFKNKVVPAVGEMEIAFDTIGPAFLSCHSKSVAANVIQADLVQMRRLRDAGLKLRYLKLQSVFNKRMPDNMVEKCGDYTLARRLGDINTYVSEIVKEFPDIEIGVVDATHMHMRNINAEWRTVLSEARTSFEKAGFKWSFLMLDRPYEGKDAFPYSSVLELEQIVREEWGAKFGIIVTTLDAGKTSNQAFHETAQRYVTEYYDVGGRPDILFLESWQKYPDKLIPENSGSEYPMTKTLLALDTFIDRKFSVAPNGVRSSIRTTVSNNVITGWIRTKDGEAISRQQVVVCIDRCNETSISVMADKVKSDKGGWFEIIVPPKFFDGKRHLVQAYYVDSITKQKVQINQSPFVFYGKN